MTETTNSDADAQALRHLELAYNYEKKGSLTDALRECDVAIRFVPNLAEAHNLRGVVLEQLGESEQAIIAYREAVRLNPAFSDAQQNLLEAQAELKQEKFKATHALLAYGSSTMQLTKLERTTLEQYREYSKSTPTIREVVRKSSKYFFLMLLAIVAVLIAIYFVIGVPAGNLMLLGVLTGTLLRDYAYIRRSVRLWPLLSQVTDWQRIDEILSQDKDNRILNQGQ